MNYLIYTRVSPKGSSFQGETSVHMQEDICRQYVKAHGGAVAGVVCDELISGKDINRPGMQEILAQVAGGAAWDVLCVYRLDRLIRSSLEQLLIFKKFGEGNKGIVSATEPLFDYGSPFGRFQLSQIAAANQYYREVNAENTRNKMISIAAGGGWAPGNPPFGYRRQERKNNVLAIDERNAATVRALFEQYAENKTHTMDIARKYKLNIQQLLNILRNPVYIGRIRYAGQEFAGKHPPVISMELFERVRQMLPDNKAHTRPAAQKYNYLLGGLVKCHCGRFMTQAAAKGGAFHYYRCTDVNCRYAINASRLEKAVLTAIVSARPSVRMLQKLAAELERRRQAYISGSIPELEQCESACAAAQTEREVLYQSIIHGKINPERMQFISDKLDSLSTEITDLQKKMTVLRSARTDSANVFDIVKQLATQYNNLADLLATTPDNGRLQREAIALNVHEITAMPPLENKVNFKIKLNYSSFNHQVWLPRKDLNLD